MRQREIRDKELTGIAYTLAYKTENIKPCVFAKLIFEFTRSQSKREENFFKKDL